MDRAFDMLCLWNAKADPTGVYAVNEFDICTGTVGGHAVLSQGFDPALARNGHGGDGLANRRFECGGNVIAGVVGGPGNPLQAAVDAMASGTPQLKDVAALLTKFGDLLKSSEAAGQSIRKVYKEQSDELRTSLSAERPEGGFVLPNSHEFKGTLLPM
jgi:hypothetical protein